MAKRTWITTREGRLKRRTQRGRFDWLATNPRWKHYWDVHRECAECRQLNQLRRYYPLILWRWEECDTCQRMYRDFSRSLGHWNRGRSVRWYQKVVNRKARFRAKQLIALGCEDDIPPVKRRVRWDLD